MAKRPGKVVSTIDKALLSLIAAASASNNVYFVTQEEAKAAGLNNVPPLIEVNPEILQDGKAAARITQEGFKMLNGNVEQAAAAPVAASPFMVLKGVEIPKSQRGVGLKGGGAPKRYPFDDLEIGDSFFVPVSEKLPDPVKTLGSTVSSVNLRFSEETGAKRMVERAVRGEDRKAKLVDGKKVMETVELPVRRQLRKFVIRKVEAGKTYGSFVSPADGALIARVALDHNE